MNIDGNRRETPEKAENTPKIDQKRPKTRKNGQNRSFSLVITRKNDDFLQEITQIFDFLRKSSISIFSGTEVIKIRPFHEGDRA